jgi:hypothetical protein
MPLSRAPEVQCACDAPNPPALGTRSVQEIRVLIYGLHPPIQFQPTSKRSILTTSVSHNLANAAHSIKTTVIV